MDKPKLKRFLPRILSSFVLIRGKYAYHLYKKLTHKGL